MKILALFAAAATLAVPLAAHAQDFDGPYVGVNVGYALGTVRIDDEECWASCSGETLSPNGISVGGVIGFNHQMGSTVLGLEGDYNWLDADKDKVVTSWPSHHHGEIKTYGSVRARAGLAVDKTLIYATGGLGIINQDVLVARTAGPGGAPDHGIHVDETKVGLAAGVGTEFQLSERVRLKMEYLYVGIPAQDRIQDQFATSGFCTTSDECTFGYETHIHTVRVGVNWAF